MKKIVILTLVILAALAGVFAWFACGRDGEHNPASGEGAAEREVRTAAGGDPRTTRSASRKKASSWRSSCGRGANAAGQEDDDDDMSPEDRRLMEAIESAMDDEDLPRLRKVIPQATASSCTEVRSDLVDALGWFGVDAMLDLLPLMADADDEVRENAMDNWTSALSDVSDESRRAKLIERVMEVLDNEDVLESMTMELSDIDDKLALQTLVNVIEGGKASKQAVDAAREHYEFVTGEEYTTVDDANKWLEENYEPEDEAPDVAQVG